MPHNAAKPRVRDVELQGPTSLLRFRGRELAHVSTHSEWIDRDTHEPRHSLRWSEMTLYTVCKGSCQYVLYIQGLSVLAHRRDAAPPCDKGVTTLVEDLPEDAEACPECQPDLTTLPSVSFEEDRFTLFREQDVPGVIRALKESGRNRSAQALSNPAQRLLEEASRWDDAFSRMNRVEVL